MGAGVGVGLGVGVGAGVGVGVGVGAGVGVDVGVGSVWGASAKLKDFLSSQLTPAPAVGNTVKLANAFSMIGLSSELETPCTITGADPHIINTKCYYRYPVAGL